jgi:phosphatidylinositol alpha-1,6-mannosyltransferase
MTTLLISEIFPPKTGGSGRWFWEMYRRLPREEFVFAAGEDPKQEEFDRTHFLRVERVPLSLSSWGLKSFAGLKGYWNAVRSLLRIVRQDGITQIHCGRCLPEGLMALAIKWRTGIPFLCYCHGEEMKYASSSRELKFLARKVLKNADFVIANSRNTESILLHDWGLPSNRVSVVNPGVDTEQFVPAPRDPAVREQLGWGDRRVILTVGRLQKRKGHDTMIRALQMIREQIPDALYAIVGDGEERQSLESLVRELGLSDHVRFMGEIVDRALIQCYQQCDLFVLPNRQVGQDIEGFGMVLVEAQACGKPVIAGASGGTAETMKIPDTGQVVDCTKPDELSAAIVQRLADRQQMDRMGECARNWAVSSFDWWSIANQASQLFEARSAQSQAACVMSSPSDNRKRAIESKRDANNRSQSWHL